MASLRMLKKDIDYLIEELLADCLLTMYFQPEKKDKTVELMQQAVGLRNDLIHKANNPAEKKNPSLVRKHYAQLRREMFAGVDGMFEQLSSINK